MAEAQFEDYLSQEEWRELFTPAHLEHFAPQRGSRDDPVPVLEVHFWEGGERKVAVMLLAVEGWNDWETRQLVMRECGRKCGEQGWLVLGLRLASAAWMRPFTQEEWGARQGRGLETYDDRREIMMVAGMALDGRTTLASAQVLRDKAGRVRAVRRWEVVSTELRPELRLTMQLLKTALEGYTAGMLGGLGGEHDGGAGGLGGSE